MPDNAPAIPLHIKNTSSAGITWQKGKSAVHMLSKKAPIKQYQFAFIHKKSDGLSMLCLQHLMRVVSTSCKHALQDEGKFKNRKAGDYKEMQ